MVFVEQLLVGWILKVTLGYCKHAVETKVSALSCKEGVFGGSVGDDVG